ncbi:MAG: 50S ribosomal protein L6 [Candidatus Spechtbacteria bacterium]|nr:50S ribosomal protein L6 [Candidatus Spechtbacteria bacterium]
MSRIGKKPIEIPLNVEAEVHEGEIRIKGPKGELVRSIHPAILVEKNGQILAVKPSPIKNKNTSALWGLTRALLSGMVHGVTEGFEKKLEIEGIGFRAEVQGDTVTLHLGFTHPILYKIPKDISVAVQGNVIRVTGIDKYMVGQVAADIRAFKKPEPYKGKGIHYAGEYIRRKVGKKAATVAA